MIPFFSIKYCNLFSQPYSLDTKTRVVVDELGAIDQKVGGIRRQGGGQELKWMLGCREIAETEPTLLGGRAGAGQ